MRPFELVGQLTGSIDQCANPVRGGCKIAVTTPQARPFYRAAMDAFEHARQHADVTDSVDAAQVALSVDYGLEMLLKAVLLERGESIKAGNSNKSIGLPDALRRAGPYKNSSAAEVLRVRRDSLQHFAQYSNSETTRDLLAGALLLVSEIPQQDFGLALPSGLQVCLGPQDVWLADDLTLLEESEYAQRDVSADGDVVAWAQGVGNASSLAVWVKIGDRPSMQLTPENEFEYMPRVGVSSVAATASQAA